MTVSKEQITAWKAAHGDGNVFAITIPHNNVDPQKKLIGYIKKPCLATLSKIARYGEEHISKACEVFIQDTWLDGDVDILKYEEYKLAIMQKAIPLFELPDAEIVKC